MSPSSCSNPLLLANPLSKVKCPVDIYVDTLGSKESRRSMISAANGIAEIFGIPFMGDEMGKDRRYRSLDWTKVDYPEAVIIFKHVIQQQYSPAHANNQWC